VRTVEHQGDDIARAHLVVALNRMGTPPLLLIVGSTDMDEPCICSLLDPVTAGVWLVLGEVFVNADGFLSLVYLHTKVLVEFTIHSFSVRHKFQFVIRELVWL
jgi:hypothetical protein